MSSHQQGASHKRHQDMKLFKPKGQKKIFQKKRKEKPNHILPHVRVQTGSIYKKVNGTSLWHMLWLIPRTAVSKKASNLIVTASSQNKGSPLVCLAFLFFFFSQSEDLIPNNTIEYSNYLHIKNTPRKKKSMAQTLYKGVGLGSEGPKPHFANSIF